MSQSTYAPAAAGTFVARGRPGYWAALVLVPSTALLAWMGFEGLKPDFAATGKGAFLNGVPAELRAAFFFGCALVCTLAVGLLAWRRIANKIEVEADAKGITSHLFWGAGHLAWDEVTSIERRESWLFVKGTQNGRAKKLTISTTGLDRDPEQLIHLMLQYCPQAFRRG